MSQHAINHSFRGTDSLLAKWNGLIGKGVKEEKKKSILGSVPCFCQCRSNLHAAPTPPGLVGGFQAEECCIGDPLKSDPMFFQGENARCSQSCLGNAERVWKEKVS